MGSKGIFTDCVPQSHFETGLTAPVLNCRNQDLSENIKINSKAQETNTQRVQRWQEGFRHAESLNWHLQCFHRWSSVTSFQDCWSILFQCTTFIRENAHNELWLGTGQYRDFIMKTEPKVAIIKRPHLEKKIITILE